MSPIDAAKERRQRHDEMFARFKASGKTILLIPTASLDSLNLNFDDNDAKANFLRLRSGVTEWINKSRPYSKIMIGYDIANDTDSDNPQNYYFQLVFGRTLYKIYLVDPGHYTISGVSYNLPRTAAFEPPGGRNIKPSPLGVCHAKGIDVR
ncbi:hypothetical protein [Pseudomonas sp. EA_15y_Pfl1_P101]|uniref:hypothetical protein n=1 Tax=Pseudomonas sp. EA_15y_Pfl1_P101 TaxID=3088684 RepID=UPI0030D98E12